MDVVYPVRTGNANEELRYSLRALHANFPHRDVYVIGAPPAWLQNVISIPHRQGSNSRSNTNTSMRLACLHPDVSNPFVWMNDDYFIMQPIDEIPRLNRGPIDDVIEQLAPRKDQYAQGMVATKRLLIDSGFVEGNVTSYELHMPLLVQKSSMLYALKVYEDSKRPNLHKRTLYGNIFDYGGETVTDNKITSKTAQWDIDATFISTSDLSFRDHPIGAWIRAQYPDKSPYEV